MTLEELRKKADSSVKDLEMPESIRTPGRTWTRYPEIQPKSTEINPVIESFGEVEVLQGEEALEAAGEKLFDSIKVEENKLVATHAANLNSVVYIKAKGDAKVEMLYEDDADTFAHLIVETRENAELDITEEFRNKGILTSVNEFYIGENSTVNYGSIESSGSELTYCRRKAIVTDHGKMNWFTGMFEGELKRTKIETVLKGDGSETGKTAVWYPTGEQHNDISMNVKHLGKNTRCDMKSRAVVDDKSRSVYEGLQKVEDDASDTSSFQDEKVLMLSDRAEVDASPKLMIEDPDVEASHAASAGGIPGETKHYMESRGLGQEKARELVVRGFFEPVIEEIDLPDFRDAVREEVERKLER